MANLSDYNAEDYRPLESRDPVPAGWYEAMIIESELTATKRGDGELLNIRWQIIGGEYDGRLVFDRVNLKNPNAKAVEIGMRQLSSICRAVGKLRISDSAELHDIPCMIDVRVRAAGPDKSGVHREAQNEVRGYAQIESSAPPPPPAKFPARPAQAAAAAPAATAAQTARKPWERKSA